jgi:hypothetical protein
MFGTAVVLVPLILVAARERRIADHLRKWPAGRVLCVFLLAVAVGCGLLDLSPQDLVGLLGTTVLIYLVAVAVRVLKPIRRR